MNSTRLLRSCAAALVTGGLLLSGCTSGSGDPDASASDAADTSVPGSDAEPLQPLPTATPDELRPYYEQKLTWRECGAPGFECTSLRVPLDYDDPSPDTELKLAVSRQTAPDTGTDDRIGSLMLNPGGPGGSAIDYLQAAAMAFPPQVRERYDLVGMDPRGVARSEPVECLSDREMDRYTRIDQTPDDQGEVDTLTTAYKRFAEGCEQRTGDFLQHVSTVDAARDMDVLRAAIGDEKLYYYGASYGTFLGATYAGLYPQRTGRLVLDGALDPSLPAREVNRQQTGGFNTAFTSFAKDCVKREDCPLGTKSAEDAADRLSAFFEDVDAEPLRTGKPRTLTESLATTGVVQSMYAEALWPRLRLALTEAIEEKDGAGLLALSDEYFDRGPRGEYGNIMFANPAVNCLDLPPAFSTPEEVEKAVPSFEETSPVFGRGFAWASLSCAYWPEEATGRQERIVAEGAAPMVVVGTTRDPATPYSWSQGLSAQLDTATLLTYVGDGHTAFLQGSSCIDAAITGYLLTGDSPKEGTRCRT